MALDPIGEKLAAQDWSAIHRRLMAFAKRRVADVTRAEDVVQDAIASVFARRSSWDPARVPDVVDFLMGVVRTGLWNERRKAKRTAWLDEPVDDDEKHEKKPPTGVADPRAWSEERATEADLHARRLQRLRARLEARGDTDALRALELFADGIEAPADVRTETGWTADRVTNVRQRLQRAALDVARADDAN